MPCHLLLLQLRHLKMIAEEMHTSLCHNAIVSLYVCLQRLRPCLRHSRRYSYALRTSAPMYSLRHSLLAIHSLEVSVRCLFNQLHRFELGGAYVTLRLVFSHNRRSLPLSSTTYQGMCRTAPLSASPKSRSAFLGTGTLGLMV